MFDFIDNYPVLSFYIILGSIIVYYVTKYFIDGKKGVDSQERHKVLEI